MNEQNRIIQTAHLEMRPLTETEGDALHALWIEPGVRRYLWDDEIIPRTQTQEILVENSRLFREEELGLWGVKPRGDRDLAGFCGFWYFHGLPRPELLYGLAEKYWKRGLAVEAARAMLVHGFEKLGFQVLTASTDPPNRASIRVLERLGMRFDRREEKSGLDTVFYKITRDKFFGSS